MKRKFMVGDIVVGNEEASDYYGITKEGYVGRVVRYCKYGDDYDDNTFLIHGDDDEYEVCDKYFDLVSRPATVTPMTRDDCIKFKSLLCM